MSRLYGAIGDFILSSLRQVIVVLSDYTWKLFIRGPIACEKHSKEKGIPLATLFKGVQKIEGQVGINNIYRGGMELIRFGDPDKRPHPKEIAAFSYWGIGRGHEDKVKVKCKSVEKNGEIYRLSWPKTLELDSVCVCNVASHGQGYGFPFFDYLGHFLKMIEKGSN